MHLPQRLLIYLIHQLMHLPQRLLILHSLQLMLLLQQISLEEMLVAWYTKALPVPLDS